MISQAARKIKQSESQKNFDATETLQTLRLAPFAEPQPLNNTRKALQFFILSDALAVIVGVTLSWLATLVVNNYLGREVQSMLEGELLSRTINVVAIGAGLILWFNHRSHYRTRMPFWTSTQQIFCGAGFCLLLDSFLQFAAKQDLSRLWLVGGWALTGGMIVALRIATRRILQSKGLWNVRTLVIGGGSVADDAKAAIQSEQLGYQIVGEVADLDELREDAQGSWTRLCNWYKADFVLIALDGAELHAAEDAIANLTREHIPFAICPPLRGVPVLGMESQHFFNHDVMLLTRCNRLEEPLPRFIKRAFDIAVSGTALLALAPVFAVVALFIKRDGGPVFYSDRRVGTGGLSFGCLKFRSMVMNSNQVMKEHLANNPEAAKEWNEFQKLRNDPRVTAIGTFIRKTSIDELPQLINVLKGDMSLVGPRPMMIDQAEIYGPDVSFYHQMQPGITGLWQVSGRNHVSFEKRVQFDRWYVSNWSLWHDIAILCKTPAVLLFRKGAY
ncbi:MAG: undecaprenyl-phosphate galactose phosphotransferase WbaP [Alphaproteobacteria bacterium]